MDNLTVMPIPEAPEARQAFLATIPDEDLTREYMRRFNERRARGGGRPRIMRPCPKGCGQEFSAREMLMHTGSCTGKPKKVKKTAAKKRSRKAGR